MALNPVETRKFAEQVVEVYASRVTMNFVAQGELERAVMSRIVASADHAETLPERADLANQALAEWEGRVAMKGPRVAIVGSGRVVEKRTTH